jgi:hypothetical protein
MSITLILLTLLFVKHFVVDFPLQKPYQWMNKGTYGHPGGLLHSGIHGIATYACFVWYAPMAAVYLAIMDAFLHYHIDWAKVNINNHYGWKSNTHEEFWILTGFDQLLHALTYIFLVNLVI